MRATLADASLARYTGRFVWLQLDFDKTENGAFMAQHGTTNTPSFYVIDPGDEHATATQLGAMTLKEVSQFLERGEHNMLTNNKTPAGAALARGDEFLAHDQPMEAAAAYRKALGLARDKSPERELAVGGLTFALVSGKQWQACAEVAAAEAPGMLRQEMFGRVVFKGLNCADHGPAAGWGGAAQTILEPLAEEAIALPATVRDHRFQLYQTLMVEAKNRNDKVTMKRWGEQWLKEIDATTPVNNDERSALDIARRDIVAIMGDPERVLPALIASEKAMPNNYNASLRLAEVQSLAKHYNEAIAACDRGLQHATGPLGRSWLLQIKGDALLEQGRRAEAQRALAEALTAAREIGPKQARENNVANISKALEEMRRGK